MAGRPVKHVGKPRAQERRNLVKVIVVAWVNTVERLQKPFWRQQCDRQRAAPVIFRDEFAVHLFVIRQSVVTR